MNIFFGFTLDRYTTALYNGQPDPNYRSFKTVGETTRPSDFFVFGEIHPFSVCQPPFGVHPRADTPPAAECADYSMANPRTG